MEAQIRIELGRKSSREPWISASCSRATEVQCVASCRVLTSARVAGLFVFVFFFFLFSLSPCITQGTEATHNPRDLTPDIKQPPLFTGLTDVVAAWMHCFLYLQIVSGEYCHKENQLLTKSYVTCPRTHFEVAGSTQVNFCGAPLKAVLFSMSRITYTIF